ncbi:MAG: hypothetical protein M8357_09695 [Desulfobulbaceae bacterium]|nr:hypothetical protein [Desulfobulbaceae bacterium]
MRCLILFVAVFVFSFSTSVAEAQNKVVVVPLGGASTLSNSTANIVNVETSYVWSCPPSSNSLSVIATCPQDCVATGGGCSAKDVADNTDVQVTGANFLIKTPQLSQYNAYQCWMLALSCMDPDAPPIGYAQVVCICNDR